MQRGPTVIPLAGPDVSFMFGTTGEEPCWSSDTVELPYPLSCRHTYTPKHTHKWLVPLYHLLSATLLTPARRCINLRNKKSRECGKRYEENMVRVSLSSVVVGCCTSGVCNYLIRCWFQATTKKNHIQHVLLSGTWYVIDSRVWLVFLNNLRRENVITLLWVNSIGACLIGAGFSFVTQFVVHRSVQQFRIHTKGFTLGKNGISPAEI